MKGFLGAALFSMVAAAASFGQETLTIDRREQARSAFLATPESVYAHYCAHCHGEDGSGAGRLWASELLPPPADLTALSVDRSYLVDSIREGSAVHGKSSLCPPWGRTISAPNIERLAQYVLSLGASAPAPEREAEPVRKPFPWLLTLVVLAEGFLLWRFLRRNTEGSHVVSKDSSVGG